MLSLFSVLEEVEVKEKETHKKEKNCGCGNQSNQSHSRHQEQQQQISLWVWEGIVVGYAMIAQLWGTLETGLLLVLILILCMDHLCR